MPQPADAQVETAKRRQFAVTLPLHAIQRQDAADAAMQEGVAEYGEQRGVMGVQRRIGDVRRDHGGNDRANAGMRQSAKAEPG